MALNVQNPHGEGFRSVVTDRMLANLCLETGDIVLFNRPCTRMSLFGCAICIGAKLISNSSWDHIGVILKDEQGTLFLLESGVKGVTLHPLCDRINRSRSSEIAIRKLFTHRNSSMNQKAWQFADLVRFHQYESNPLSLMKAGIASFSKLRKHRMYDLLLQYRQEYSEISEELECLGESITNFQKMALYNERERKSLKISLLEERLHLSKLQSKVGNEIKSGLFCSELVAEFYQHIGVLSEFLPPSTYSPANFASSQSDMVFPGQLFFSKEIFIRALPSTIERYGKQFMSVSSYRNRDSQERTEELNRVLHKSLRKSKFNQMSESSFTLINVHGGEAISHPSSFIIGSGTVLVRRDGKVLCTLSKGNSFSIDSDNFEFVAESDCEIWQSNDTAQYEINTKQKEQFLEMAEKCLQNHHVLGQNRSSNIKKSLEKSFMLKFEKGEYIIHQGDSPENLYILCKGKCSVESVPLEGNSSQTKLSTLSPGVIFGDISMLYGNERGASVIANEPVVVLAIDSLDFLEFHSSKSRHMHAAFQSRLFQSSKNSLIPKSTVIRKLKEIEVDQCGIRIANNILKNEYLTFSQVVFFDSFLSGCENTADFLFKLSDMDGNGYISFEQVHTTLCSMNDNSNQSFPHIEASRFTDTLDAIQFKQWWISLSQSPDIGALDASMASLLRNWSSSHLNERIALPDLQQEIETHIQPFSCENLMSSSSGVIQAAVAATVARSLVSPLERLKLLSQISLPGHPVRQVLWEMWKDSGVRGLFRGNGINSLRVCFCFTIQSLLLKLYQSRHEDNLVLSNNALLVGGIAGVAANVCTHPLDVVRAHIAAQKKPMEWKGISKTVLNGLGNDKYFLCRGLVPAVAYTFLYIGFDTQLFQNLKSSYSLHEGTTMNLIVSGAFAMAIGQTIAYPFDTIRRRMQLTAPKLGMSATAIQIFRTSGIRGFYKGVSLNWVKAGPSVCATVLTINSLSEYM